MIAARNWKGFHVSSLNVVGCLWKVGCWSFAEALGTHPTIKDLHCINRCKLLWAASKK